MNEVTQSPQLARMPNSGRFSRIRMIREPQTEFGWARKKTIHVPAGWYELERWIGEPILVEVNEQIGTILGWYGLHGENVNVRVEIK
jgi:hypothetical protein